MQEPLFLKVVKFFIEHPYEEIYLRQLAKKLKLSPFAVKKYTDFLITESIITEERKANLRYFKANSSNLFFKQMKIAYNVRLILQSRLIDFLKQEITTISSIVLYGSLAKGEDDTKSDIDILIIGKEKRLNVEKYEEKIGKKITLQILSWSEWNKNARANSAFYYEVISNGKSLFGELPIVRWK